ncbi:MAG TPA: diguanylate cyclase, partial [Gammaproteobacteria bacterium]|nr:diguanylate cyclase [Gammaproteobacteria bacterium]
MLAEASDLPQTVLHAASLEAGLEILRRQHIAVILLDLSLPDSTGLDTFQTLQRHAGGTPIIVLTGSRDRSLALRAIQEGAQDYLVKDEVNASTLSKAIHYAVERKHAEMRLRESENRYKTLVDSVPDAILLIRDGAIAHCNERASDLFGIPYDDLIGRDPSSLAPPRQPDGSDSIAGLQAHLQKRRQDSPYLFEWQFQGANEALIATEVILDTVVLDGEPQVLAIIRDITDRKQAEQRIRFQASLLDQVHNAVLATDSDDRIIYWNRFATRLYLWPADLAMGQRFTDLIMPDAEPGLLQEVRQALAGSQIWEGELELKRRDGSTFPALLTLSAVLDEFGRFSGCVGIASDITVRKEVERKLEHNAFHDALTGLPNRMLFADRLSHSIARGAREGGRYAVMMMDLDRFKIINDSLGHMVGDELLIQFSRRVESCLRPQDTLARLGGDEFTILLDDIQHTSDAVRVAERIHEKMSQPFLLGGNEVYSSASIGITFGTANYKEPAQAVRDADIAMY